MYGMYAPEVPTYLRRRAREDHRLYGCLSWRTLDLLCDFAERLNGNELIWR